MTSRVKLKPGQKGTKKLLNIYGDALVCVRYRYDEATGTRIKTAEIIVDRQPWSRPSPKIAAESIVPVQIGADDTTRQQQAKAAGGRWDSAAKAWQIPYGRIQGTELEKFIILETLRNRSPKKSI